MGKIGRREFLKGSVAAVAAAASLGEQARARDSSQRAPNIVLINCDDLGYGDVGCYEAEDIATPNLDKMAKEGMRFTSFYSGAPVCTPSRAALLTGRYAIRSGLSRVLFPGDKIGIPEEELTLAEALKDCGYATACIGKWHLGHLPRFLPTRHGFDYYYGIPYSNDMGVPKDGYRDVPLMCGEEVIERPAVQDTLTRRYTEETIKFIKQNKARPFFVYLPHTMPHKPIYASQAFKGRSKRGLYGDVVEELDWSAGQIIDALRQEGLESNTLVMFTSDNGPYGKGSAGPLRGAKAQVFEGGFRVPFIAHWPGHIRAGSQCSQPASMLDMLPTLLALAGGKPPGEKRLDGRDIRAMLLGMQEMPDYAFFYFRTQAIQAVRFGRWKLHVGRGDQTLETPELYDLVDDIGEQDDVSERYPKLVGRLTQRIQEFRETLPADAGVGASEASY